MLLKVATICLMLIASAITIKEQAPLAADVEDLPWDYRSTPPESNRQTFWVQEGERAWLECVSENFESHIQKWIGPNGKELTLQDDLFDPRFRIIGDYNLEVLHVTPSDGGLYQCIVSGHVFAAYELHVIRKETTPEYETTRSEWERNRQEYETTPSEWERNRQEYETTPPEWDRTHQEYETTPPEWERTRTRGSLLMNIIRNGRAQ